ncbi:MAG: prefoldin subunit alpha [Nanoarchaeota archaeon]
MEMSQETINKAQVLEVGMKESEQHLEFIESQISELSTFHSNLKELSKSSDKKMLASIGKGVYLNAELRDKSLLVEIGKGIMINKSPEEIENILEGQIKKLSETKIYLQNQMDFYLGSLNSLINSIGLEK